MADGGAEGFAGGPGGDCLAKVKNGKRNRSKLRVGGKRIISHWGASLGQFGFASASPRLSGIERICWATTLSTSGNNEHTTDNKTT
jgi:hypothetical protein